MSVAQLPGDVVRLLLRTLVARRDWTSVSCAARTCRAWASWADQCVREALAAGVATGATVVGWDTALAVAHERQGEEEDDAGVACPPLCTALLGQGGFCKVAAVAGLPRLCVKWAASGGYRDSVDVDVWPEPAVVLPHEDFLTRLVTRISSGMLAVTECSTETVNEVVALEYLHMCFLQRDRSLYRRCFHFHARDSADSTHARLQSALGPAQAATVAAVHMGRFSTCVVEVQGADQDQELPVKLANILGLGRIAAGWCMPNTTAIHPDVVLTEDVRRLLPAVLDFGVHRGRAFYVMERIDGWPLRQVLRWTFPSKQGLAVEGEEQRTLMEVDLRPALLALLQTLRGCRGFVHGDIKPENMMLCVAKDGSLVLRLLDIAPQSRDVVIGKVNHEAIAGCYSAYDSTQDRDCASLAAVIVECCTGDPLHRTLPWRMHHSEVQELRRVALKALFESANPVVRGIARLPLGDWRGFATEHDAQRTLLDRIHAVLAGSRMPIMVRVPKQQ